MPLKQYYYDFNLGIPIGKLYPLDEALGGGIAYARIFNCARLHNGEFDLYDYIPMQKNALLSLAYSIKGMNKKLNLKINHIPSEDLGLWKILNLSVNGNFEKYIITSVYNIDYLNQILEIEVRRL